MTKRKLENTKKVSFNYNSKNSKNIILLKDENSVGKKYTEKGAYELIKTIKKDYPKIKCHFEPKAEEQIRRYAKSKNKSKEPIDKLKEDRLKQNRLEIIADK